MAGPSGETTLSGSAASILTGTSSLVPREAGATSSGELVNPFEQDLGGCVPCAYLIA